MESSKQKLKRTNNTHFSTLVLMKFTTTRFMTSRKKSKSTNMGTQVIFGIYKSGQIFNHVAWKYNYCDRKKYFIDFRLKFLDEISNQRQ